MAFSWKDRQNAFGSLETQVPELVIIGAGIAGVSTAAHAARLGLRVLVIEKEDIASGATGNSTGLAHAGLRYLAQGRLGYVFREGHERYRLQELAPQWVQPFNFVLPVYRDDPYPFWQVRVGTFIYDMLNAWDAFFTRRPFARRHRTLTVDQVKGRIPGIRIEGLLGGIEYFVDAKLQDARFALGYAQQAAQHGARFLTHCSVDTLTSTGSGAMIVLGRDLLSGKPFRVASSLVVNATGAWIDEVREKLDRRNPLIEKSKGVHLIVDYLVQVPMIMASSVKGKVFFILPLDQERSVVGTTDTAVQENADRVTANDRDILELLQQLFYYFPYLKQGANLTEAVENYKQVHIRDVYWGIRPLIAQPGSTVDASREHKLVKETAEFWSLAGVKLTAGRAAGFQTAVEAWKALRKGLPLPSVTWDSLPGGELWDFERFSTDAAKRFKLGDNPMELLRYLISMYGTRYVEVLQWAQREDQFGENFMPGEPWILAQVPYAIHEEMVLSLNDLLWRRTKWARMRDLPDAVIDRLASLMARLLLWSDQDLERHKQEYRAELKKHRCFKA